MKKIMIVIMCVSTIGCFSSYQITSEYDKFSKSKRIEMNCNEIYGEGISQWHYFNLVKIIKPYNLEIYYVKYVYTGSTWMFIEKGESLQLMIDGNIFELKVEGAPNREVGNNRVYETAYYPIPKDMIIKMANAKNVYTKIIGSKYYSERSFGEDTFEHIRNFYTEYVR